MQSAIVCGGDFGVDCGVVCMLFCDVLYHSTLVSGLVLWYHGLRLHHIVVAVVWYHSGTTVVPDLLGGSEIHFLRYCSCTSATCHSLRHKFQPQFYFYFSPKSPSKVYPPSLQFETPP